LRVELLPVNFTVWGYFVKADGEFFYVKFNVN
jgi:hypothetical protein